MCLRLIGPIVLLLFACASAGTAATDEQIKEAIRKGAEFLKTRYPKDGGGILAVAPDAIEYGIGQTCLSGLAILEAGIPANDPSIALITERVRTASYSQTRTYQVSLCLMYLDRLGDPNDVPLIQMLAVRLLVGQNGNGGWTYNLCPAPSATDIQRLKAIKADQPPGKMHPVIEQYAQSIAGTREPGPGEDNSNTQFAVLAVWVARKHGVNVERALELSEQRFLATQNPRTGGWSYSGPVNGHSTPAMHCAGLIGLATAVARREERRLKTDLPKKVEPKKKEDPNAKKYPDDPFFNPPQKAAAAPTDPKKPAPAKVDGRDRAVQFALAGLGAILAESLRAGRGSLYLGNEGHGQHDLYFYWSLERVGVIYGLDKIGGVDWYAYGAHTLVRAQSPEGSWRAHYRDEVDTAFAVLFLCKSNLARDLSSKVQREVSTEMRAGAGAGAAVPKPAGTGATTDASPIVTDPVLPGIGGSEAAVLAGELLRASEKEWPAVLKKLRDTKGHIYTKALLASVNRLDGDRRRLAREALAERLARMTANTLRSLAKDEDPEMRRGAVLAMAMKDEKTHVSDLIAALQDDEEIVVRAAKAGLKSLAGQDFGPGVNASAGEKKLAVAAWNDWLAKQKN
jgi:hypothetical protein